MLEGTTEPEKKKLPEDEAESPESLTNVWHGFSQDTTFHGVRFVTMHHAGVTRRILWAFVIVAASIYLTYQIQDRIGYFLKEPILVSVAISFNDTLKFPSIAICNQNQFRFTAAVDDMSNVYLEQIYNDHTGPKVNISLEKLNNTAMGMMNKTVAPKDSEIGLKTMNAESLDKFLGKTWDDLLTSLGHTAPDMIISCFFNGEKCTFFNFDRIITDHGLCYKFRGLHFGSEGYKLPSAEDAGSKSGLYLLLNAESYEYSPGEHRSAGFKVVLLDPDDIPMIRTQGEGIGPGTYTFVSLEPKKTIRINSKTTKCTKGMNLTYFDQYTELACHEDCMARQFVKKHGCRKSSRWKNKDDGSKVPLCLVKQTLGNGTAKVKSEETEACIRRCDSPCEAMDYDTSFSFLKTSENDIKKLDKEVLERIMNDNERALDYRVNTDKDHYLQFLNPIKEFKKASKDVDQVYGSSFHKEMSDKGIEFERQLLDCRQSMNQTQTYYRKLETFYNDLFASPAELHLPDVTVVTRSIVRNIETSLANPKDKEFRKNVEFQVKSTQIMLNDSKDALVEIFCLYGNFTPVLPNATDYNSSMSVDELYLTKPLRDVGKFRIYASPDYNYIVRGCVENLGLMLKYLKSNDKVHLAKSKKFFIDGMIRLGKQRADLMQNVFLKPSMDAKSREKMLEKLQREVELLTDPMNRDMDDMHYMYTHNEKYESWVTSLREGGFLDVSEYAKQARDADTWAEANRFPTIVLAKREYLTGAFSRFSRLSANFWLYQTKVLAHMMQVEKEIKDWVEDEKKPAAEKLLYDDSNLNVDACLNLVQSKSIGGQTFWENFFKTKKQSIKNVMDDLVPRFNKLKYQLDAYVNKLEPSGTFYKDNFAAVDIFFQEMSYQTVKQDLAYDIVALLSDVGGSMGLLIGGSCLTVCELLDTMAFSLGLYLARRSKVKAAQPKMVKVKSLTDVEQIKGSNEKF